MTKRLLTGAWAWVVAGPLLALAQTPLFGGWDWPIVLLTFGAYSLLGCGLLAAALAQAWARRRVEGWGPPLVLVGVLIISSVLLFQFVPPIARWSDSLVFRRRMDAKRAVYAEIVTHQPQDSAWGAGPWSWYRGERFLVDSGPPFRVAILQPTEAFGGREAAVFDASGEVAATKDGGGITHGRHRLGHCRPVEPGWYRCRIDRGPSSAVAT